MRGSGLYQTISKQDTYDVTVGSTDLRVPGDFPVQCPECLRSFPVEELCFKTIEEFCGKYYTADESDAPYCCPNCHEEIENWYWSDDIYEFIEGMFKV